MLLLPAVTLGPMRCVLALCPSNAVSYAFSSSLHVLLPLAVTKTVGPVCDGNMPMTMQCEAGMRIAQVSTTFGRDDTTTCPYAPDPNAQSNTQCTSSEWPSMVSQQASCKRNARLSLLWSQQRASPPLYVMNMPTWSHGYLYACLPACVSRSFGTWHCPHLPEEGT